MSLTNRSHRVLAALVASALIAGPAAAAKKAPAPDLSSKPATRQTAEANQAFGAQLNLADRQDFEDANRGLIATLPDLVIKNAKGNVVWDGARFAFIKGDAPPSVNPSLWRQEQLNNAHGLFKVSDGIYQIRGYDVSNMTLIEGKTGWIVIDPLVSSETARATMALAEQHLCWRRLNIDHPCRLNFDQGRDAVH